MLSLKSSTLRSDKPRRSRSALSRFPHSGFHDEAHIRRPTPEGIVRCYPKHEMFQQVLRLFTENRTEEPSVWSPFRPTTSCTRREKKKELRQRLKAIRLWEMV